MSEIIPIDSESIYSEEESNRLLRIMNIGRQAGSYILETMSAVAKPAAEIAAARQRAASISSERIWSHDLDKDDV